MNSGSSSRTKTNATAQRAMCFTSPRQTGRMLGLPTASLLVDHFYSVLILRLLITLAVCAANATPSLCSRTFLLRLVALTAKGLSWRCGSPIKLIV